jgi:AcrR family transcriptional regulator
VDKSDGRTVQTPPATGQASRKPRKDAKTPADPRSRMIEAMLANVGEQGYVNTVVADVIAKAVASRKTFYEHFEDKHACFFAMSDEIADEWVERLALTTEESTSGPDIVQALVEELSALTLESPAALRVLAVEMTAAGTQGIERRERALEGLASPFCRALGEDNAETRLLARAIVGSILRLLYARARRGAGVRRPRRGDLLSLGSEATLWATSYLGLVPKPVAPDDADSPLAIRAGGRAPGTLSLSSRAIERRGLPRGEGNVSRSFVIHNQRERILDSLANLSAAKSYGATTIPEIVQEAAVSVQAFYEHFAGKEDVFLVAYEIGHRKTLAMVERAYESEEEWPAAVRAGVTALLEFLASEPSYAHLALVDALTASPKAAAVAHDGMVSYTGLLEAGSQNRSNGRGPAAISAEATAGALLELCFVYAVLERTRELPELTELAGQVALRPFLKSKAS